MLSLGVRGEPIDETIEFVLGKRNDRGRCPLENSTSPLNALFGAKERKSKWITFRALKMLRLAGRYEAT